MDVNKIKYYLDIAETVAKKTRCIRRNYGAIIVKNDTIISTGYNGSPRGTLNCTDLKICKRKELNIKSGSNYELCRSVHAEQNCIINASREKMIGSTLFLVGKEYDSGIYINDIDCCLICKRMIINAGIENVIFRNNENKITMVKVSNWIDKL